MIKAKLESILTRSQPTDANESADETEAQSPTNLLHECSECSTVYLSEGSHVCSNCNSMTTVIETPD